MRLQNISFIENKLRNAIIRFEEYSLGLSEIIIILLSFFCFYLGTISNKTYINYFCELF